MALSFYYYKNNQPQTSKGDILSGFLSTYIALPFEHMLEKRKISEQLLSVDKDLSKSVWHDERQSLYRSKATLLKQYLITEPANRNIWFELLSTQSLMGVSAVEISTTLEQTIRWGHWHNKSKLRSGQVCLQHWQALPSRTKNLCATIIREFANKKTNKSFYNKAGLSESEYNSILSQAHGVL